MLGGATWCLVAAALHLRQAAAAAALARVQLAGDDHPAGAEHPAGVQLTRRHPTGVQLTASEAGDSSSRPEQPERGLLNLTEPGLCYAAPLQGIYREHWQSIARNVKLGRQRAKDMKVIFAGLIRSAEEAARQSFVMLRNIGLQFKDYHFLVFENDSTDRTVEFMKLNSAKDPRYEFKTEVLSMGNERKLEEARMTRMATVRNKLRDWIEDFLRASPGWDLIFMYDYDLNTFGPNSVSPHAIFGALGRQESLQDSWDMMCATSLMRLCAARHCRPGFYDTFAFRQVNEKGWNWDRGRKFFRQYDLVPVDSCFGGLAMYKPEAFLRCRYNAELNDCEHVGLHQCMREKGSQGRMYMDPLLSTNADAWVDLKCVADPSLSI